MESRGNTISDAEIMGEKADITHEETVRLVELTAEEKAIEKKLCRRIDILIMPLVILVYLMNYIDRLVLSSHSLPLWKHAQSIASKFHHETTMKSR